MPNPAQPTNATAYEDVLAELKELLPRNYIGGLITSNDADAVHDVNITAGECRGLADDASLRLATEITKQIDAAWAAGDDAGGIDAGAVAADTLYAVWLIKDVDGTVDALFSTSFAAPTMPGTYNKKRLIGAVMTDGGDDIIAFTQSGDYFRYTGALLTDVNDATITDDVWETGTLSVPPNCLAKIYATLSNVTNTDSWVYLGVRATGASDTNDASDSFLAGKVDVAEDFEVLGGRGEVLVDAISQMEYTASEDNGGAQVIINTLGFTMLTRREP